MLVAIAYEKGVIMKVPYENTSGDFFTMFIRSHFNFAFGQAEPKLNDRR